jgi:hypothetical protein
MNIKLNKLSSETSKPTLFSIGIGILTERFASFTNQSSDRTAYTNTLVTFDASGSRGINITGYD